ncbi:hypothetical protein SCHPADRAFT_180653 [Schizopora paradoxa]|uniref:Methyltransferase domain-containing protein n=1 Tax=Schizopora paradoxa TaxID=27342 RepID=A0A0H2S632_9AGAM|nr:hypothetical protein SCHPADRAFT_180653 [Schizopora paradoxa]
MNITRELPVPPIQPALDDIEYELSEEELAFLKVTVSQDADEIKRRAETVRKEAYAHYPYPCIRRFHFLNLMMLYNPIYSSVVDAGKKEETWFLDIGCCMGTDVRKLVLDGYRAANIAGCDLRSTFIDIGRDKESGLFRDVDTCEITFFAADILELSLSRESGSQIVKKGTLRETVATALSAGQSFGLENLKGCLTHVYTGALFHLFDEDTQYAIALRVALLLDLKQGSEERGSEESKADCVIFGRHQGKEEAGVIDDDMGRIRYGHNAETWTRMWQRAFAELEGKDFVRERVRVHAEFVPSHVGRPGHKWFVWSVSIV